MVNLDSLRKASPDNGHMETFIVPCGTIFDAELSHALGEAQAKVEGWLN
jgi:hypothetical protein